MTLATAAEIVAAGRAADEAERKRAAIEGPIEALVAPYRAEALRRPGRHAPGRRPGRHPEAREGPHGRRAEDRRRLLPGPPDRRRQDPGDHVRGRSAQVPGAPGEARPGRRPARSRPPGLLDRGGRPEEGAGEELHPDQRRPRPARDEARGRARLAVRAGERRLPRGPDRGVLRLADGARESAVRPGGRQSALAVALRRGPAEDAQRLRHAGRDAERTRGCSTGWPPSSSPAGSA